MLSDFQQDTVWKGWLGSEIRADYFAKLVQRFQRTQKLLVVSGLILSSGATVSLLTTTVPPRFFWIKPTLTFLAAALSLWSLVAKYERNAIDCADLHSRWNALAFRYEKLWSEMDLPDAAERLEDLREQENTISKSSTAQPTFTGLLEEAQANVVMHHQGHVTA